MIIYKLHGEHRVRATAHIAYFEGGAFLHEALYEHRVFLPGII
jgi:hypothetical protein